MSMPTGSKFKNGYATVASDLGGMEYRVIVEKMAADGDEISISTARNLVLRASSQYGYRIVLPQQTQFFQEHEQYLHPIARGI